MHDKLGHPNHKVVKNTAAHFGITVKDQKHKCHYCALAKHKVTPISKSVIIKSRYRCERINIDISSVSTTSFGGSKYWLFIQDDYTDFLWSYRKFSPT